VAVDTLGHLLAAAVTPASEQKRAQVADLADLAEQVQTVTGNTVELAYVDQGDTGTEPTEAAAAHGIQLEVVKLPDAQGPGRDLFWQQNAGWSNAVLLGWPDSGGSPVTMNS